MLYYPENCLRGCDDCEPLAQIKSDYEPITFICVGRNDGSNRTVDQDVYRMCHKSAEGVDVMHDCDKRDLTDHASVIVQALSMLELEAVGNHARERVPRCWKELRQKYVNAARHNTLLHPNDVISALDELFKEVHAILDQTDQ